MLLGIAVAWAPAQSVAAEDNGAEESAESITWTDASGTENTVRALSAEEVRERGLDRYVDMENYSAQAPQMLSENEVLTPTRDSGFSTTDVQATACWSHWFRHGVDLLYGQTDVTWCGDGSWLSYATSQCWGHDGGYPTYEYLGCDNYPNYGSGWNVYEVRSVWHLCIAWIPPWGGCTVDQTPWAKYQYQADGGVVKLGGS